MASLAANFVAKAPACSPLTFHFLLPKRARTLIALLENHQQIDGAFVAPEALQAWMGKQVLSEFRAGEPEAGG